MSGYRLLVAASLVATVSTVSAGEATDDLNELEGAWKGWVVEGRGDDPKQRRIRVELTIKGNTITAVEVGK